MNPLDWTAQPFLTLYLCLMLLAAAVVLLVQEWVCRASAPAGRSSPEPGMPALDTIEMAYLAAGRARAADTVLLGLLTAGAATLDPGKSCFVIDASIGD
jgi:uncharacterized protein (TIGR04222 family)